MNTIECIKYYCDETEPDIRRLTTRMYLNEGSALIADAYQDKTQCSDEVRERVEKNVEAIMGIYEYGCLTAAILLFAGFCVNGTKAVMKFKRIIER